MTKTKKKVNKLRKRRVSRKINRRIRKKRLNKTRRLRGGSSEINLENPEREILERKIKLLNDLLEKQQREQEFFNNMSEPQRSAWPGNKNYIVKIENEIKYIEKVLEQLKSRLEKLISEESNA